MTDQLTDNEVIARFMDMVANPFNNRMYSNADDVHTCEGQVYGDWHDITLFQTSWERLMPVWYKFKEINPRDYNADYEVYNDWCKISMDISKAILHSGPSEACKLLAEGIRWYNSVKK
jgi:hypothetical protein